MATYDPEKDIPYGLASADFPVSVYDRPAIGLGNLIRGDVDGLTRAMLSPDTLSPQQLQSVTNILTKGKKPGPVMKTILDVATNPFVILGLAAGFMYPMGSTKVLLNIRKGLIPKAAAMSKSVSGFHGAMTKLRTVPKLFDTFWDMVRGIEKFTVTYGQKFNNIYIDAGPLSKVQGLAISARLDGLHKTSHSMVKVLQNEPEYLNFFGGKVVPIAAGLQGKMSPGLVGTSDKLRGAFNTVWKKLASDSAAWGNLKNSLTNKGYQIGGQVDDYFPRKADWNKYYKSAVRGSGGVEYKRYLEKEIFEKVGRHEITRSGGLFANVDDLLALENAGQIPQGFNSKVIQPIISRWTADAGRVTGGIWDDIAKLGLSAEKEQALFVNKMTEYYSKGPGNSLNFVARLGSRKRAEETLSAMARSLQGSKFQPAGALQKEVSEIGKVLAVPGQYSLDPWKATQGYVNAVASDYVYHGQGYGKKIMGIVNTPGIFKGEPHLRSYVLDSLLPHTRGFMSWQQMNRSINSTRNKDKILGWLKNHPMVENTLGAKNNKILMDYMAKPSALSQDAIGGQVAHWFHLSTLGLNLSATSANAMQTFITTKNHVGAAGIYRGLRGAAGQKGLIERATNYGRMRYGGMAQGEAFKKAFPEFVEEMGEWSKHTERLLSGDIATSGMTKLFKVKGVWEKIKTGIMAPFSGTEAGNQLLAFYSGRHQHLYENATKLASAGGAKISANATKAGGTLALLTQFAGGPLGVPSHIMDMNPMWRQYMHFPMRFMSYLHGSLRMGADPSKWNWGTMGRVLSSSTAAYIAGRNLLGLDMERGLLFGALPVAGYEKASFYPFPFVPPAASIIGEMGRAALTGDPSRLTGVASMLVPAGVAARRAYKSLAPRYANYKSPTEDGRIPLYNHDKALVGTLSPLELSLRAIGLRPQSVSAEAGAAKWLVSQRDRIRGYRRDYTMALFQNEPGKAEKINGEFQKAYPELGPLKIKKTDITALENRREISRLQRIERGIPTAYRPLFSQVIGEASLARMTEGVQMSNLGGLEKYLPQQ